MQRLKKLKRNSFSINYKHNEKLDIQYFDFKKHVDHIYLQIITKTSIRPNKSFLVESNRYSVEIAYSKSPFITPYKDKRLRVDIKQCQDE